MYIRPATSNHFHYRHCFQLNHMLVLGHLSSHPDDLPRIAYQISEIAGGYEYIQSGKPHSADKIFQIVLAIEKLAKLMSRVAICEEKKLHEFAKVFRSFE